MQTGVVALIIGSLMWVNPGQTSMRQTYKKVWQEPVVEVGVKLPPGTYAYSDNPPCGDPWFDGAKLPPNLRERARKEFRGEPLTFSEARPPVEQRPLSAKGPDRANCGRLVIVMPKAAQITRIVKEPQCPAGGWCGFAGEPAIEEVSPTAFVVWVVFKNWSHNQGAMGTLKVYYR